MNSVGIGARYTGMSIAALSSLPIAEVCDDAAHLYLWTTNAFMYEAHDVARAWGFKPKTICTWGKVTPDGRPSMKTGYWFRGATEHWLFCVRGSLRITSTTEPTLYLWPRTPHSVKPDAFYDLVERVSPAPRLELFARKQRLGWDSYGNEALCHVDLVSPTEAP
jgi:N6-adenosine-specific RNA methylase IME4